MGPGAAPYERARIDLGHCYRDGKGVGQDYMQAYKWYSIAARQKGIRDESVIVRVGELTK
jgi:TPR repeat protein